MNKRHSDKDTRSNYPYAVLNKALEVSAKQYGEFEVLVAKHLLPNNRTVELLEDGKLLNVIMVVTTPEWEKKTIPIRIPLRFGVLAYRLLAIHKDNQIKFESVVTIDDLKKFTVGLHRNWATWDIMTHLNFKVGSGYSYEALFGMLDKGRFDYLPRGIHEIYDELEIRKSEYPDLVVEPKIALYIPAPFYMFVSPKHPHLAVRLTTGLETMLSDGTLKAMFDKHYSQSIKKANLSERTIINIGNPLLPPETPLDRKELWLDINSYK
ncbi:transporter substrate-binding domain-containing protein [Paraglaciecola aquimarina]|uniref:Transporter substrate-binding domain-containing protein n=1 Tax=Paraglaciecola algarum TaxID=3050085 RepID=A0ABS9DAI3_9ALTE|nr:transporter substrate-binding domain-containing protein [Paraglaciecola sp. G1-23]MCF2949840.1 transporter substrate-binding domain-containing protein [Paraglaciecola sp. G1-23]